MDRGRLHPQWGRSGWQEAAVAQGWLWPEPSIVAADKRHPLSAHRVGSAASIAFVYWGFCRPDILTLTVSQKNPERS